MAEIGHTTCGTGGGGVCANGDVVHLHAAISSVLQVLGGDEGHPYGNVWLETHRKTIILLRFRGLLIIVKVVFFLLWVRHGSITPALLVYMVTFIH